MTAGSLTDLDPPAPRERRWPFYLVWLVGGIAVGAVLVSRLPAAVSHPATPIVTEAPAAAPATPVTPRFRVAPLPVAPARP